MTHEDLIKRLASDMRRYSGIISFRYPETPADEHTDTDSAIADAEAEVGVSLPSVNPAVVYWLVQRAKRHLYAIVLNDVALKYQAKAFSAHQQFDHINAMIESMDKEWELARETLILEGTVTSFGYVTGTGICHDNFGRRIT